MRVKSLKASTAYLYGLECLLFLIVIAGLFDFRQPITDKFLVAKQHYAAGKKLNGWNDSRLTRFEGEADLDYAARMSRLVSTSFYHCSNLAKDNVFELVAARFSTSQSKVGFLQPDRYCGYGHQGSYILANILMRAGLDAAPFGMNGQVFVLVKDDAGEYIFDPYYGVGPMPYKDDMTDYIPTFYGTDKAYNRLRKPFATSADDRYYYSMQWLNDAEKEQNRILHIVKFVYSVCVVLFFFHTCFLLWNIFMKRRRGAHGQKTRPEQSGASPALC